MVCNLTIGKEGYGKVEGEMKEVLTQAEELKQGLGDLVDQDIEAFDKVMDAYKLPKDDERRKERIEQALKRATQVPYQVAESCFNILELSGKVARKGNRSALSDTGAAAYMAEAALQIALLNVDINLELLPDKGFKHEYWQKRESLGRRAKEKKDVVIRVVSERMGGCFAQYRKPRDEDTVNER